MQEMSIRATQILNTIQRFFTRHLVDTYGCDYTSSGLTAESVQSKLRNFFQRVTSDGPRFDTYLVYYSGHVFDSGDWALAGEGTSDMPPKSLQALILVKPQAWISGKPVKISTVYTLTHYGLVRRSLKGHSVVTERVSSDWKFLNTLFSFLAIFDKREWPFL